MTRVFSTGAGSAMATSLDLSEQIYKVLFSKSDWNAIVRAGVYAAGEDWVTLALPKRFTNFAFNLGYRGKKNRANPPLVDTGRLRSGLLARAYAEARATGTNVSLTLRLPTPGMRDRAGNPVGMTYFGSPKVGPVLRTITDGELTRMAQVMTRTMEALFRGADSKVNRKGTEKRSLSTIQRASLAHTVKTQGSLSAAHTERKSA